MMHDATEIETFGNELWHFVDSMRGRAQIVVGSAISLPF
jgi:hypothetical protein